MTPQVFFEYKKYVTPPPAQNFTHTADYNSSPPSINAPNWLNITYQGSLTAEEYTFSFSINPTFANNLPIGETVAQVAIRISFGVGSIFTVPHFYRVTVNVIDTVLLELNPTDMAFSHIIGETPPVTQNLSIQSENNWSVTKDASWITLSNTVGVNTANIAVGANVTGLAAGNYNGIVTVNDGLFVRNLAVSLSITGEETPTEFLNITPLALEFVEVVDVASTQTRQININASESWTTSINAPWLLLDIANGDVGETLITASVDTNGLAVGAYQGAIEFVSATFIKTVFVSLRISDLATEGIESGNLYYADDKNRLTLFNTNPNTFAIIDFVTSIISDIITYPKRAPYFRGLASIFIGEETENLLLPDAVTSSFITRAYAPLKPISLDFKVFDKDFTSGQTTEIQSFTNVKFINGKTPVIEDKLCYLPEKITTTKDAILALSFLSETQPDSIEISGDITQSIGVSTLANDIYTAIVNLSDFNLSTGNVIDINVSGQSVNVTIKDTEPEHTLIAFENEWQCPEYFMCTGQLKITNRSGWSTTKIDLNGDEYTKILETNQPIEFSIDTGFIYSQEECDWLVNIFKSKRMFVFIKGKRIEVEPSIRRLEVYRTRKNLKSYNLKFRKAII